MVRESRPGWALKLATRFAGSIPAAMRDAMDPVASEAKRLVYLGHPDHLEMRTGALKRSISTDLAEEGTEISASVGSDLVYAPVHELGSLVTDKNGITRYIPPRPFIGPAFDLKRDEVTAAFHRSVAEIIGRECR